MGGKIMAGSDVAKSALEVPRPLRDVSLKVLALDFPVHVHKYCKTLLLLLSPVWICLSAYR